MDDLQNIQKFKKCRFVLIVHKKSIFMLKSLLINRNIAIFAPHLVYEVQ